MSETREEGIARLVTSMSKKIGFVAPEEIDNVIRRYIETAWDRGAEMARATSPTSVAPGDAPKEGT